MDPELLGVIREEVRKQMNIILSGASGENTKVESEDIQEMYPGMPTITQRPVMHPYGYASRAPDSTIQVVARQGDHPGNRIILGHRDSNRPTDLGSGDTAIYNDKVSLYLKGSKVLVGSPDADEPLVLGNVLLDLLTALITDLDSFMGDIITGPVAVTTTPGNPAPTHPALIATLTALRASLASTKAQFITASTTNILSQEAFTERGGPV